MDAVDDAELYLRKKPSLYSGLLNFFCTSGCPYCAKIRSTCRRRHWVSILDLYLYIALYLYLIAPGLYAQHHLTERSAELLLYAMIIHLYKQELGRMHAWSMHLITSHARRYMHIQLDIHVSIDCCSP